MPLTAAALDGSARMVPLTGALTRAPVGALQPYHLQQSSLQQCRVEESIQFCGRHQSHAVCVAHACTTRAGRACSDNHHSNPSSGPSSTPCGKFTPQGLLMTTRPSSVVPTAGSLAALRLVCRFGFGSCCCCWSCCGVLPALVVVVSDAVPMPVVLLALPCSVFWRVRVTKSLRVTVFLLRLLVLPGALTDASLSVSPTDASGSSFTSLASVGPRLIDLLRVCISFFVLCLRARLAVDAADTASPLMFEGGIISELTTCRECCNSKQGQNRAKVSDETTVHEHLGPILCAAYTVELPVREAYTQPPCSWYQSCNY